MSRKQDITPGTMGYRIQQRRTALNMNQEKLAELLNVGRDKIGSWEQNKSSPDVGTLIKLCNIFNCDFGYLVGEYEEKTRPITDIRAETGLSPEAVEVLRTLKRYSKGAELQLISDLITFTVHDGILETFGGFSGELFFQVLNDLLYLFKLQPKDEIRKAGYYAIFQRLFSDFLEDQLKSPFPDPEE